MRAYVRACVRVCAWCACGVRVVRVRSRTCVRVRACAYVRVRACVRVCVYERGTVQDFPSNGREEVIGVSVLMSNYRSPRSETCDG